MVPRLTRTRARMRFVPAIVRHLRRRLGRRDYTAVPARLSYHLRLGISAPKDEESYPLEKKSLEELRRGVGNAIWR